MVKATCALDLKFKLRSKISPILVTDPKLIHYIFRIMSIVHDNHYHNLSLLKRTKYFLTSLDFHAFQINDCWSLLKHYDVAADLKKNEAVLTLLETDAPAHETKK